MNETQPTGESIGELRNRLPVGEWVELDGIRIRRWPDPDVPHGGIGASIDIEPTPGDEL